MNPDHFILSKPFGFVTAAELRILACIEPLCPVLLRFHEGRLIAAAQDATDIRARLESTGWGLRDVCVTAGRLDEARARHPQPARRPIPASAMFDESQCGGVFDGNGVVSDTELGGAPGF